MSLDQNLFTLAIAASTEEPGCTDLTDPNTNTIYYRKRRHQVSESGAYDWGLYDPLSSSLLATITAPNASSKSKIIELHNPPVKVELTFTGTLSFKWCFKWEDHTFEWRREACFLLRKPDPPVQVAVTREPAGKIRTSQVQVLDYNLNRFDINDRKGLEIAMIAALLTFPDQADELKSGAALGVPAAVAPTPQASRTPSTETKPPVVPQKSNADPIAAFQTSQARKKSQANEVIVGEEGQIEEYAQHCVKLLKDDSLLYIVLRAQGPEFVSKVVQVAEAAKRTHYKNGGYEQELHQYVTMEDVKPAQKGPRVIKLDDEPAKKKEYKPPQTLTVHLSKIPMPELQPKAKPQTKPQQAGGGHSGPSSSDYLSPNSSNQKRAPSPSRHSPSSSQSDRPPIGKLGKAPPGYKQPAPGPSHNYPQQPQAPNPVLNAENRPKSKEKDKKDKGKEKAKSQAPPQQQPYPHPHPHPGPGPGLNAPHPSNPYAKSAPKSQQQSPQLKMPGAMPYSPPYQGGPPPRGSPNYFPPHSGPPQPHYNSPNQPAPPHFTPPPTGSNPTGQNQPTTLSGMVVSGIANVGYSLLDRMTHKQPHPPTGR